MINLHIPYNKLELIDYEGAGNKTPVLDLSFIKDISLYDPAIIRTHLENDLKFRKWLKIEGLKHHADTIMIYYSSIRREYQYVTFIGEPNAPLTSKFSEMCGNGIRSLALHIYLNDIKKNKELTIWAGSVKQINIGKVDIETNSGEVIVDMGRFNYIDFNPYKLLNKIKLLSQLQADKNLIFTLGSNGAYHKGSEPHLVVLYTWNEFKKLNNKLNITLNTENITSILRNIVSTFGKEITFATDIFLDGMNFNIGIIKGREILMATHERNLSANKENCQLEIHQRGFCRCNTLACGTGGAVVANAAKVLGLISSAKFIKTIQPGGEIKYNITHSTTFMIGSAIRV